MKKDTLCVYSGGMDSTVMLHLLKKNTALAVTFDYGSNHAAREIECARMNCEKLGIHHIIIPLSFMKLPRAIIFSLVVVTLNARVRISTSC